MSPSVESLLTDESANAAGHMDYAASRVVVKAASYEPTRLAPAPVGGDRVDNARDNRAEDDVTVEVTTFGDRARNDRSASRGKRALNIN